jgi:DNA-binding CsgD family transcriptional regulator
MGQANSSEAAGNCGAPSPKVGRINVHTVPDRPGLIVIDASLSVVAFNSEALQILAYPDRPENIRSLDVWLANKVRADLMERRPTSRVVGDFRSARRTYLCRSFPVQLREPRNPGSKKVSTSPDGLLIVMLERQSNEVAMIAELSERFGLTCREQETVQFLLEGLTSKEIALRMKISPNTVKAFIRLVMVKMGVSTRSGIIGKIVGSRPRSEPNPARSLSQG